MLQINLVKNMYLCKNDFLLHDYLKRLKLMFRKLKLRNTQIQTVTF